MASSIPTSPPAYAAASFDATPTPSVGAAITFVALDARDY